MKSAAVFSLVTFIFVGTVAANVAAPVAVPIAAREASPEPAAFDDALLGRSADTCKSSPGCYCNHVQGQFCGNEKINRDCRNGYVYECNAQTGQTCVYGIRDSCKKCGKLTC